MTEKKAMYELRNDKIAKLYDEGFSFEEIADETNVSISTVRKTLMDRGISIAAIPRSNIYATNFAIRWNKAVRRLVGGKNEDHV